MLLMGGSCDEDEGRNNTKRALKGYTEGEDHLEDPEKDG
jgi:hypothetical protein